ncbi:stage II sporulation protein D [Bacillus kexueae]|uniref:stage II sporulation protein D n=1 Tax=Aeribacillus kexueae TaxID=2078952 RepID=UPI001FAED670|nr:stage II sporulation protein D [Bacillus kexueae]
MKQFKPIIFIFVAVFIIIIMVPSLLVAPFMESTSSTLDTQLTKEVEQPVALLESPISIAVYRTEPKVVEEIPLEEYVIGVVASEMPAEFELEALKAQALAARTYIVKQLLNEKKVGTPDGADVTDTQMHQVYKNKQELKAQWGADYEWKLQKITEAVAATQGKILTYDNTPIDASFFSTSNGFTENSEAYWTEELPYLKSVESPWDTNSPKFSDRKVFTLAEFEQKLGVSVGDNNSVGTVVEKTPGQRVGVVNINGKTFTGREIREALGLNSTDFTWERKGEQIIITTKGNGHGVGMSQYGANFMAEEGKNYEDIVLHYYSGVQVAAVDPYISTFMAKQ